MIVREKPSGSSYGLTVRGIGEAVLRLALVLVPSSLVGYVFLIATSDPDQGANIGGGLFMMFAEALGMAGGGLLAARRRTQSSLLEAFLALVLAYLALFGLWLGRENGWSLPWDWFVEDFIGFAPYVMIPGVFGVFLGHASKPR
jgi:hypothetical protein